MSIRDYLTILSFAIVATACSSSSTGPDNTGSAPAATTTVSIVPNPGDWNATAGFGTFTFTVSSSSTAIESITYNFQNYRCGGANLSGGISASTSSGWPINNRQFSIQNNFSAVNLSMTIEGTFESSTRASGSFSASSGGTTCTGTWTATR